MMGFDAKNAAKQKKAAEKHHKAAARRQRMNESYKSGNETIVLVSSTSCSDDDSDPSEAAADGNWKGTVSGTPACRKRGRKIVVTQQLAAALDRTKVSNRKAVFVIAETIKSLGQSVDSFAVNAESIRLQRRAHRSFQSVRLKDDFRKDAALVVHWDGKLMQDLTGNKKVDRLPILVSGKQVSQLLTVAKLTSGTGKAQATAVFEALKDWNIVTMVNAMCFDTTSANTGKSMGACVLLEQMLGKDLLYLACRHHIMELVIGSVFQACMGTMSGPEVLLFKRFQARWEFIDRERFDTSVSSDTATALLCDVKIETIVLANKQLEMQQQRDDYREFLELTLIFLGEIPCRGVRFMAPGAMHHARWLSKVIYSLKVWMFRSQFVLTPTEEKGLHDVCIFVECLYLQAWMTAPSASNAPYNDFRLLQSLINYSAIHPVIAKVAFEKPSNHLWYLSDDLIGLALFDSRVSVSTKRLMVKAMREVNRVEKPPKRAVVAMNSFKETKLEHFVSKRSMVLMEKLRIPSGFLEVDPEIWTTLDDFTTSLATVQALKVVNDHAERGVALIQ